MGEIWARYGTARSMLSRSGCSSAAPATKGAMYAIAYSAILTALAVTGTTTELKRWWKRCAQYMRRVCIHRCAQ